MTVPRLLFKKDLHVANTSLNEWLVGGDDTWCLARYNDHTHLVALPGNRPDEAPPPL